MTRRALLIASQTFGLRGANNDAAAVDALLADREFPDRRLLTDHAATREGILQAFRALIRDTAPGDPVLLYYSGHGGRIANPRHSPQSPREPAHYACIIPFDHTKEEFRGIFNSELSALLAELALRTANITVILDCCHAAALIREDDLLPKSIPLPWRDEVAAHRDWLLAQGYDLTLRAAYVESNPHAVRLLACAPDQLAFEACRPDGRPGGLLTTALLDLLATTPADTTWHALAHLIRARVTARHAPQVPELHGPIGRLLFTPDALTLTDILTLTEHDGHPHLTGGALHGVTPGSRYLLMPPNANRPDPALALAEAEVLDVAPDRARIALHPIDPNPTPPLGTRAFLHRPSHPRHPVRLDLPPGPLHDLLVAAITASPHLLLASPDVPNSANSTNSPIATLTLHEDHLHLTDHEGHLVRHPWPIHHAETWSMHHAPPLPVLDQLARVRALLDQFDPARPAPPDHLPLDPPPTLHWGVLRHDREHLLPLTGAHLHEGDHIFLRVTSHSPHPLYLNVIGIGVSRSIRLLTASQPNGVRLDLQQTYTLGQDFSGDLSGIHLVWHADVPRHAPQPLTLLALFSNNPLDLHPLESSAPKLSPRATRTVSLHFIHLAGDLLPFPATP